MAPLDWVAWAVLSVQMPIPFFWLAVHPFVRVWRARPRFVYLLIAPVAWLAVAGLLLRYRDGLFAGARAPGWAIAAGLLLIFVDAAFLFRVHRELGGPRLVGRAEIAGSGELAQTGLYARVRHPRYTGMMGAVLGVCLMAATLKLWLVAFAWWLVALLAVRLEESELRARFGTAYDEYARRVPRFLPFRFWPREE